MREEIAAAVVFVSRLVKAHDHIPKEKIDEFSKVLSSILTDKFKSHWYTDEPTKGQGYRCIRINHTEPVDAVLERAANVCGLSFSDLKLPQELTLWVDPKEVCCRFGESQGSFCQLAVLKEDGNLENQAHTINIDDHLQHLRYRRNMNLNIVTTRTSANKLKAMALKSATYQQHFQQQASYQHNNKYQQNLHNNQQSPIHQQPPINQQPPTSTYSSRPFHKAQHKNTYHGDQTQGSSYNGHQGQAKSVNNHNGAGYNNRQNKDRFHWVRNGKQTYQPKQDQVEQMRLSPN